MYNIVFKHLTSWVFTAICIVFCLASFAEEHGESEANWIEGAAILIAVFIVVFVTAFNDWTKERQFRGLQDKLESEHRLSIIRAGETIEVPVADIVVGDVCFIRYGKLGWGHTNYDIQIIVVILQYFILQYFINDDLGSLE